MTGRNTKYEEMRRRRLEELETDATLRSELRRRLLDLGGAHSNPSPSMTTASLPRGFYDWEVLDLTNPNDLNDRAWSEGEGTDAESCIPSSFPPDTDATDDSFAVADVKVMTKFDNTVGQDARLLWAMGSPEVCKVMLRKVKYRMEGWCKLATKKGGSELVWKKQLKMLH